MIAPVVVAWLSTSRRGLHVQVVAVLLLQRGDGLGDVALEMSSK